MRSLLLSFVLLATSTLVSFAQLQITSPKAFCPDDKLELNTSNGIGNYQWSSTNGNLTFDTPNKANTTFSVTEPGSYEVEVEAEVLAGNIVTDPSFETWDLGNNFELNPTNIGFETTYHRSSGNEGGYITSPGEFRIDTITRAWCSNCTMSCSAPSFLQKTNSSGDIISRGKFMYFDGHSSGNGAPLSVEYALDNYVWQVSDKPVKPNTTYYFQIDVSSWYTTLESSIMLLVNGTPLELVHSYDSSSLGTIFTITNTCIWYNIYGIWESGSNTTATLTVSEPSKIDIGSELAIDDINFYESIETESQTMTIDLLEDCSKNNLKDTIICKESPIVFEVEEGTNEIQFSSGNTSQQDNKIILTNTDLGSESFSYNAVYLDNQLINDPFFVNGSAFETVYDPASYQLSNNIITDQGEYGLGNVLNGGFSRPYCTNNSFHKTINLNGDSIPRSNFLYAHSIGNFGNDLVAKAKTDYLWSQTTTSVTPNTEYTFSFDLAEYQGEVIVMVLINDEPLTLYANGLDQGIDYEVPEKCTWTTLTSTWNSGLDQSATIKIAEVSSGYGRGLALDNILMYTEKKEESQTITVEVEECPITGINTLENEPLTFFPNPASNQLTITNDQFVKASIYTLDGVFIQSSDSPVLSINNLSNGIYLLEVITESGRLVEKFMKN